MINYENIQDKCIKKINENGEIWFIPIDAANSDYQTYLAHLQTIVTAPNAD